MKCNPKSDYEVSNRLIEEISKLCHWLDEFALPLWLNNGFDQALGIFHERLDSNGSPVKYLPRRLITQCRQIAVYSSATLRGTLDAKSKILKIYERVRMLYRLNSYPTKWIFSVDYRGHPADETLDSYSLAFVVFALSWLYRLEQNDLYLQDADEIFEMLDVRLAADHSGVKNCLPKKTDLLSQNPNMHLFEASISLYQAAGRISDLQRAGRLAKLFDKVLFDRTKKALPEQHCEGWIVYEPESNWFEPGHHFEWSWLMRQLGNIEIKNYTEMVEKLYERAYHEGVYDNSFVIERVGLNGNFLVTTSRNWGVCELIKSSSTEYQEAKWDKKIKRSHLWKKRTLDALNQLKQNFLSTPLEGLWNDRIDQDGNALTDYSPASSFYHIFFAIVEAERIFSRYIPVRPVFFDDNKKALFFNRDCVIKVDCHNLNQRKEIKFIPDIFEIVKFANNIGVKVFVVSSQSVAACGYDSKADDVFLNEWMFNEFFTNGLKIDCFYYSPFERGSSSMKDNKDNKFDRKQLHLILKRSALEWNINLKNSLILVDSQSDMDIASSMGIKVALMKNGCFLSKDIIKYLSS